MGSKRYRLLGFAVWRVAMWYLRYRYRSRLRLIRAVGAVGSGLAAVATLVWRARD